MKDLNGLKMAAHNLDRASRMMNIAIILITISTVMVIIKIIRVLTA